MPLAQLAFAVGCHIYGPHQYRVQSRRDRALGDDLEYYSQNYPAASERISQGINFPAMVLDYPLRDQQRAVYEHDTGYTLIWISPSDLGFFLSIALFWHGVGRMLDRRLGPFAGKAWPRSLKITGLGCGLAFGILSAAYAIDMLGRQHRPWHEIGTFGILWAISMVGYFGWGLAKELGPVLGNGGNRDSLGETGTNGETGRP